MAIGKAIDAADISETTKKVYHDRLKKMQEELKLPPNRLIRQPTKVIDWITKHSPEPQTQKSYLAAILALFKHVPNLKEKEPRKYQLYTDAFNKLKTLLDETAKENKATQKQEEGLVPWEEIISTRDKKEKGSDIRLLLSMYTYIPPVRSDFDKIYIYTTKPQTITHPNYITLYDPPQLILTEYKTAKTMGPLTSPLPAELVDEINASLTKHPREWLFLDRFNQPYKKPASFTKWVNRNLLVAFNKPLTISLIRHAYISQLDFNKLTIKEKETIGKRMGHNLMMQDRYRVIQ